MAAPCSWLGPTPRIRRRVAGADRLCSDSGWCHSPQRKRQQCFRPGPHFDRAPLCRATPGHLQRARQNKIRLARIVLS